MELHDCAFPGLAGVEIEVRPAEVFDGVNLALLVGASPRKAGMQRSRPAGGQRRDLRRAGRALSEVAGDDVQVVVTGNPANTNALIAYRNAPRIARERFTALTRLGLTTGQGRWSRGGRG